MLPKEAIEEFKQIYKRNYKIELTNEEAARRANNLVLLYASVYRSAYFGQIKNLENADGKK